ncbi:MAG TPA: putative sugar nucleotidyl transferase [Isosphaeraceae bacterium]|jgi:UDP-N-acetylglucosamine diphosphorylase/glucosamine-1-phosphate N-acetyltransferase|nr:putative sugar nucleotidyl transferase [Isosphaeraceae bacterium]
MRLCLVEDEAVVDLEPLTLTRPAFALRLGCERLLDKMVRAFGINSQRGRWGAIVRPYLTEVVLEQEPLIAVNDQAWLAAGPAVVANARWVPPATFVLPSETGSWVGFCEGQPACALVTSQDVQGLEINGISAWFEEVASEARCFDVGGEWIHRPWDLVTRNAEHINRDFTAGGRVGCAGTPRADVSLVGPADRLFIHESVRIDPYTVFDTSGGPIVVEADAIIQPFTRVEGPCYIGRGTQLFRANLRGGVTLGPNCRIGGEVEASIVHGHSNKYHEGFLGHAYIGEWVNLGAITSNSDLRNDYDTVSVPLRGDPISTGQTKIGCFIGDHTRTGMGSMLNTGTAIGVMCNVLPAGFLLPKHIPSFTAIVYGKVAPGFRLDRLFATARTVKERRGQSFTAAEQQLYSSLFEGTRLERERAFQKHADQHKGSWPVAAVGP